MKSQKNHKKITDEDKKSINNILNKMSEDIQKFTEKSLYTEHTYNGKKYSHNKDN
jgi:hypothetical protein